MKRLVVQMMLLATTALAHDFRPGVLSLREISPDVFEVNWTPPLDGAGGPLRANPVWPAGCFESDGLLRCSLEGTIRFQNLSADRDRVLVVIRRLDGAELEVPVQGPDAAVELGGGGWPRWILLGVEHLVTGADHLAFLLGLLLICAQLKRVALALTAFTLAHSLTLACSALGLVRLSQAPVEAAIALSVLLVAHESLGTQPTATKRWPWAVALLFGLVHGFGFAGALGSLGLHGGALARALLGFNLGLELAQLGLAALALGVVKTLGARFRLSAARTVIAYGLGTAGAFWFFARTAAIF